MMNTPTNLSFFSFVWRDVLRSINNYPIVKNDGLNQYTMTAFYNALNRFVGMDVLQKLKVINLDNETLTVNHSKPFVLNGLDGNSNTIIARMYYNIAQSDSLDCIDNLGGYFSILDSLAMPERLFMFRFMLQKATNFGKNTEIEALLSHEIANICKYRPDDFVFLPSILWFYQLILISQVEQLKLTNHS